MGRNRKFFGHHLFKFSISGSVKCQVSDCKYEYKPKSGEVHNKPLKGHLKHFHPEKMQELAKHGPPISCKRKTEDIGESSDEISLEVNITKKTKIMYGRRNNNKLVFRFQFSKNLE